MTRSKVTAARRVASACAWRRPASLSDTSTCWPRCCSGSERSVRPWRVRTTVSTSASLSAGNAHTGGVIPDNRVDGRAVRRLPSAGPAPRGGVRLADPSRLRRRFRGGGRGGGGGGVSGGGGGGGRGRRPPGSGRHPGG